MSWGTGMRIEDWFHFRDAAVLFKVWVLVRWTNPDSLEYVGRQTVKNTYIPKPIDCKPKTADRDAPGREHKGLVVDPVTVPEAISPSRRNKALSSWESFLGAQGAHDAPSRVYRGATSMGIVHASLTTPSLSMAPGGLTGRSRGRR